MTTATMENVFKAFGEPVETEIRGLRYDPENGFRRPSGGKTFYPLVRSDLMLVAIQKISHGGENKLHAHRHADGFWWVLKGRIRFYDAEGRTIECGPSEGVLIPRMVEYWFEKIGDEDAELLQVEATDQPTKSLQTFMEETRPRDAL